MSNSILSHEQLAMFMTPKEIKRNYAPHPDDYLHPDDNNDKEETTKELWNRKLSQSSLKHPKLLVEGKTLRDHIREHGVQQPVTLNAETRTVMGGHHRIASAAKDRPKDLIPVVYSDRIEQT